MKKLFAVLLSACMVFSLIACSGDTQSNSQNQNSQSNSSDTSQKEFMEITIAIPAEPSWLDAAKSIGEAGGYVSKSITEYLVTIGNNGTEYQPMLAESWEQGDGYWTVHLRQGVKFLTEKILPQKMLLPALSA